MNLTELLIRITAGFIVLFILARVMGRKEISQMTFFNFVSAIAIGSITANMVLNSNISIRNGFIALISWALFTIFIGYIDIFSKKSRKLTTGEPIIVIKEGKIMEHSLRKTRLDVDRLRSLLRQKNIFAISDVHYAIFETNGKLSVVPKEGQQPVTKADLSIPKKSHVYPTSTEIISDGEINTANLNRLNLDQQWLDSELKKANIKELNEVFYAEINQDGTLYIDRKDDPMVH